MDDFLLLKKGADLATRLIAETTSKGLLLFAVAGMAAFIARSASAALRHHIWFVAVAGMLILPILSGAIPKWQVLPSWAAFPIRASNLPMEFERQSAQPKSGKADSAPSEPAVFRFFQSHNANLLIAGAWAIGFVFLTVRLAGGLIWLRFSVRNAEPASGDVLIQTFNAVRARMNLGKVELRIDSRRTVPFVCGAIRRFVVLPAIAREWPAAQLHAVLNHELAHIKRHDPLLLLVTSFACDDHVLNSEMSPADYATHLISTSWFAQESGVRVPAMLRRSQVERRIVAALEISRDRSNLGVTGQAAILCAGLMFVIPLAIVQSGPEAATAAESPLASTPVDTTPQANPGSHVAIELQSNGRSSIILDQFEIAEIARTLSRISARTPKPLVLIRHIGGTNHLDVVKLARLCRQSGLRCTFVSNFSTNTAPLLPPVFDALPSRSRFVSVNVESNGKFALRAEGFARAEVLTELNDLRSARSAVLVRSQAGFFEFPEVRLALNSMFHAALQ